VSPPAALHLSPHPDDELIGAPATLMALRDAGWRVVNLACGLGSRPDQRGRRERELREACRLAGLELVLADADPRQGIEAAIEEIDPVVVLSPGPGDRHPAHKQVASLAREALEARGKTAPRWWMWALWGSLERPNLATAFDAARLREIQGALSAHRQELRRNDYRRLVRGRSEAAACLAPELLFGFGSEGERRPEFAEMLCEVVRADESWLLGSARWLDPRSPLPPATEVAAARLADPAVAGEGGA
jgi:LmbE family N-acetylglucosaminyl deacetylase